MEKNIVDKIYSELELTEDISREFIIISLQDIKTFDEKQHDYGPTNISTFGELGVLVRCSDKLARLRNMLYVNNTRKPLNEYLDDSWKDLSVYGVIARLVSKGKWPK